MKNKRIQGLIKRYQAYNIKAKRKGPWINGVRFYHCYLEQRKFSFWDDFAFFIGKERYVVIWQHLRYVYMNDAAENAEHEYSDNGMRQMYSTVQEFETMCSKSSSVIKPSIKVTLQQKYKMVEITTNDELINEFTIVEFAEKVKRYIKDHSMFYNDYKNITYDSSNYANEYHKWSLE